MQIHNVLFWVFYWKVSEDNRLKSLSGLIQKLLNLVSLVICRDVFAPGLFGGTAPLCPSSSELSVSLRVGVWQFPQQLYNRRVDNLINITWCILCVVWPTGGLREPFQVSWSLSTAQSWSFFLCYDGCIYLLTQDDSGYSCLGETHISDPQCHHLLKGSKVMNFHMK